MGPSFVNSYCTKIAEGEKDPRNLMIAFSLARVLGVEFDLGEYVEALFDVTFCYFPITFKPPPDDPYGISSEDLQVKLR
jgi:DNA repair/transcription protein MET18/MMS19